MLTQPMIPRHHPPSVARSGAAPRRRAGDKRIGGGIGLAGILEAMK